MVETMSFEDLERQIEAAAAVVRAVRQAQQDLSRLQSATLSREADLTRLDKDLELHDKLITEKVRAKGELDGDCGTLREQKQRLTDEVQVLRDKVDDLQAQFAALKVRVG